MCFFMHNQLGTVKNLKMEYWVREEQDIPNWILDDFGCFTLETRNFSWLG